MKSYANVQNYFVNYQHLLLYNVKDSRRGVETVVFVIFMHHKLSSTSPRAWRRAASDESPRAGRRGVFRREVEACFRFSRLSAVEYGCKFREIWVCGV